jgi:putative adenylate-forming enzyme
LLDALTLVRAFLDARSADQMTRPAALAERQARLFRQLQHNVLPRSAFYAPFADKPLDEFPIIDKAQWMAAFDRINTVGVRLADALAVAQAAEHSRDFGATLNGVTVGLSTGTSRQRGVFLVSRRERMRWAGVMFAKLAAQDPLRPRRIAFLLRANSGLYESAGRGPVRFRFFDLLQPWSQLVAALNAEQPSMIIAPASVLRALAQAREMRALTIAPREVVSVAEVLYPDDRAAITASFNTIVQEVYQATEGLLATTCHAGALHLNEAFVHIEEDWLDRGRTRFAPIVTDLTRTSQPVVRYRLDDVLQLGPRCVCGRAARTIAAIDGRCDEICAFLDHADNDVMVFPDFLVRAVLAAAPDVSAFQIVQPAPGLFEIRCNTLLAHDRIEAAFANLAQSFGAKPPRLTYARMPAPDAKRRRVVNLAQRPR